MTTTGSVDVFATTWELQSTVEIAATAEHVYDMVSDITRMGEWSSECIGGSWISGAPGAVGSRFQGVNREHDAMWTSESEVVDAQRPATFRFSVLMFCPGEAKPDTDWIGGSQLGDMTWGFEIEDRSQECVLTQRHTMRVVSPFYRSMIESMPENDRFDNVAQRREHLQQSMEQTLARVKAAAEKPA